MPRKKVNPQDIKPECPRGRPRIICFSIGFNHVYNDICTIDKLKLLNTWYVDLG